MTERTTRFGQTRFGTTSSGGPPPNRRVAGRRLGITAAAVLAAATASGAAPPPASGLDPGTRAALLAEANAMPRLRSLLVSIDGELVEEHYFHGAGSGSQANLKSVSKTLIALLVGIAIDQGHLEGVHQPITDFFPEQLAEADEAKQAITVGNLLSMQSGLQTTSNRNYGRWVQSRNWVQHALSRPMVDRPGGRMIYSTGSTHLLSAILTRATGQSTLAFGREHLARPLGITLPAWLRDPQGIYFGGNEMTLTPRALAAVGEMVLGGGSVGGRQVISPGWLEESFQPRTRSRYSRRRYGYGWWIRTLAGHRTYYAWGYGGQYLFVIPELDAVVVATSSPNPGAGRREHRRKLDALIAGSLVPAIRRATRSGP